MTQAQVKLLDIGHSHKTFLTTEFGNILRRAGSVKVRTAVFVVGFVLPAVMIVLIMYKELAVYGALGVIFVLAGAATERWLFFVEAQHVVNLYHGRQRV
jgi:DMSO reductase anchor subunit